ncbi:MAG: hypothetical protein AAGA60_05500 [Cyanobacteria bacterium P01_E01_bin.42]
MQPTNDQAQACVRVCQMLSNCYRNVEIFRFDEQTGVVFIFASEDLQMIILSDGEWRFLNAA